MYLTTELQNKRNKNWWYWKEDVNKSTIIVGAFNTPFFVINRKSRKLSWTYYLQTPPTTIKGTEII